MTSIAERTDDRRPCLDLDAPVLERPDGQVQLGWSPTGAVVIDTGRGGRLDMASLLRALNGLHTVAQLVPIAQRAGLDAQRLDELIAELGHRKLLRWVRPPGMAHVAVVVLHGRGPLADQVVGGLAAAGIEVHRSVGRRVDLQLCPEPDVVLLVENLVPDPSLLAELVAERVPHLPVRLRDGAALVGPLVLPGRTSCVRCADHHRTDADPQWPLLAAQLMQRTGGGNPAAVRAAAALAVAQVEHLVRGGADGEAAPASLGATLELDPVAGTLVRRAWPAHPGCGCGAHP